MIFKAAFIHLLYNVITIKRVRIFRMRKHFPTLLATLVYTAIYGSHAQADLAQQCMVGVPVFERELVEGNFNELPVQIESDTSTLNYPNGATFAGNVTLEQGNRRLKAEQVDLNQDKGSQNGEQERTITATGDVNYDDNIVKLTGNKAWSNLNTKDADIFDSKYQLVGRQGRGSADKIALRENRYMVMSNGTFTSCLPNDNSWSIAGSEIIQDNEEQLAEIWNARFNIGPVPVFYSPYLQIPTGDKRRSGFLLPSGKYSSNNGIQIGLPYYWNIAPNFDATFTPNVIGHRGVQWQNEFRYLLGLGGGLFQVDWLPSDRRYDKDMVNDSNSDRWLFHWQHDGVVDKVWRLNANYTKVSDNQYLNDLDTVYGESTDGYISQKYSVGYADKYWNTSLGVKQFQVFTLGGKVNSYRALPQLDITNYQYNLGPFSLQTYGQIARFTTESEHNPKATRMHIEPTLSLPIYERWGSFDAEARLMATHFQQTVPDSFAADYFSRTGTSAPHLDDSVSRVLPKYKINGKLVFDRDMDWLSNYTQTLEPRIQYLYVPYKDQSNIYIYDTTLLQSDYAGLFRDKLYGGLDRIASANQLTTGVTSRIYDDQLDERFNISVGQTYYFEPSRTGDEYFSVNKKENTGSLVWAADSFWKINEQLLVRGGVQYDDRLNSVSLGDLVFEYRHSDNKLLQLNYRYASQEYISAMVKGLDQSRTVYQQDISQVGAVASYPINNSWAAIAAYYYDPKLKQTNDALVGVQYANCCWGFNVSFERKIVDWNKKGDLRSDYDNKISFNIELRGLSNSQTLSTSKMLRSNILPYQRAF
jgi:LPS-assembly protein